MSYRFMRYPLGKAKAVTLSYDDGARQDLRLAEVLGKHSMKCTFNICKAFPDSETGEGRLSAEEIERGILSLGHEVAVHGFEHKAPGNSTDIEIIKDVLSCRESLETAFDCVIRGMAYPDNGITRVSSARYCEIKRILDSLGIAYARTLGGDNNSFSLPEDWHAWMPTAHHQNPDVMKFAEEFVSMDVDSLYWADRRPRLFYLWGHSFEFDSNDNWIRLEEICEILGGKDDVWYATNIEIYNYVKAYEQLEFNARNSMVYNPTLYDIWFVYREKTYCVKSGEKLTFSA